MPVLHCMTKEDYQGVIEMIILQKKLTNAVQVLVLHVSPLAQKHDSETKCLFRSSMHSLTLMKLCVLKSHNYMLMLLQVTFISLFGPLL